MDMRELNLKMKAIENILATAVLAGAMIAVPASAAVVLKKDANGMLLGATGVKIGTATYNVDFSDGSCASIYGSCSPNKFDFKTAASALDAANALLNQVLTGSYRTYEPGKINGCGSATCDIFIAYKLYDADYAEVAVAANRGTGRQFTGVGYPGVNDSTSSDASVTFARFTLQTTPVVPEPATWAMMTLGFGALGFAMRRGQAGTRIRFA